jgi:hypothetical protein
VAVSARALIGCGLSCGQASLRSGPSPGRPELGRRGGGLKHAGRYSPRRSCPSLGLPKSRRALPAPRPNSLQHSGAHFDAHAVTPITPITQSASNARRVGGSLTARRRTITPTSQQAVSAARSSRRCLRLKVEWRRAKSAEQSHVCHLRSRTRWRRGGSPPERFRQAQREASPPDTPERPACLRLREQPSSGRSGGLLRAQGSPATDRTAAV